MTQTSKDGALAALGAAACFGVTVPLVQRFDHDVGSWTTAALLYIGATLASLPTPSRSPSPTLPPPLTPPPTPSLRAYAFRITACALLGAAIAPAVLAMGLRKIDGAIASLLLGFEASFTVLLARLLYREAITRRLVASLFVMVVGGALLLRPARGVTTSLAGGGLVLFAVLCWASDSALMRPLSALPGGRVVRAKSMVGVAFSALAAMAMREPIPPLRGAAALLACGALGYGVSLQLYLGAQRRVGAARTAAVFSVAPFFGAAVAIALGERTGLARLAVSAALLAFGVFLQATEPRASEERGPSSASG